MLGCLARLVLIAIAASTTICQIQSVNFRKLQIKVCKSVLQNCEKSSCVAFDFLTFPCLIWPLDAIHHWMLVILIRTNLNQLVAGLVQI